MSATDGTDRRFLFLQGPHGPFFRRLAKMLRATGAETWRVGFNRGDQAFWRDPATYIPFRDALDNWTDTLTILLAKKNITDIVLYGDTRPVHAQAVQIAQAQNITVHVFEEGYLRPYWVTYERDGSNGHSPLAGMSVDKMRAALETTGPDLPEAPARWGDMRQHIFYGALYHWHVMFRNQGYRNFQPHRAESVRTEFKLHLFRFLMMPFLAAERIIATSRIKRGGFPYHLTLLQLEHDSAFQTHSPFDTTKDFITLVIGGFKDGSAPHHHLVFKAHPLEDGRVPLRRDIRQLARSFGVDDRVHYVHGGKLAELMDHARSVVTVNSTAAQQALWRGLPLKVFGASVYDKPEFVSGQSLSAFFAQPTRPDIGAYRDFRRYLLETSQVSGGFYSLRGRRQLLRQVVDMILAPDNPYEALSRGTAAPRQQLHVVK